MTEEQATNVEQIEQPRGNGPGETISERAQRAREAIPVGPRGLEPKTYQDKMTIARDRSKAYDLLPPHMHDNYAVMASFVQLADRCNLDPVMMSAHTYIPAGSRRLAFDAQLFAAILYASGLLKGRLHFEFAGEGGELHCTCKGRFKEDPDEWLELPGQTLEQLHPGHVEKDGRKFVKGSPLWDRKPKQQLRYDVERDWIRTYAPHIVMGMYTSEEIIEMEEVDRARHATDITPTSSGLAERLEAGRIETGEGFGAAGALITNEELAKEMARATPKPSRRPARPARPAVQERKKTAARPGQPAKAKTRPKPPNKPQAAKAQPKPVPKPIPKSAPKRVQPTETEDAEEWPRMTEPQQAYVNASKVWIGELIPTDHASAHARWNSEWDERDALNVPVKARTRLKEMLDAKVGEEEA